MVEKIVNTSTEGDSLMSMPGVELAKNEGFGRVNKVWYNKTKSFDEGREYIEAGRESREDIKCVPSKMVPYFDEETCEIGFEYEDGRRFDFTEHALCQFGTRTNICHTYIKQNLNPILGPNGEVKRQHDKGDIETLYRVLKNGHRHMSKDHNFLWRTYTQDGNSVLRACLSENYRIIDNTWYLDTLEEIIPGGRLSHFDFSDADTIFGNVLIPDSIRQESDSEYGGMISMSNCEIGTRVNSETPGLFRYICFNGNIWGLKKGERRKQVHRGKFSLNDLAKEIRANIEAQIPLIGKRIDMLLDTRNWKLDGSVTVPQVMTVLCNDLGIRGQARIETLFEKYNKDTSKERTAFDIIDAITRTSQTFDAKAWVDTDLAITELVQGGIKSWERLNAKAKDVTKDDLAKLLKGGVALAV